MIIWLGGRLFLQGGALEGSRAVKKRHFCAISRNASFYQDRLGTNIGKTQKREMRFLIGELVQEVPPHGSRLFILSDCS